ncbi:MAG: molybdopterin cofactor-binding domain-containing protein, partial [Pseudomonadota bacterium]
MQVTRRGLAAGAAIGGGLLVAWFLLPRSFPNPMVATKGEHVFDAWIKIGEDSVVTVAVPQLEMGQGITTLLPQIIAQELGADWRQIAVAPAAISGAYPNIALAERWSALWDPLTDGLSDTTDAILAKQFAQMQRFTATADGTALAAYEEPARLAAASARAMLAKEAGARWGVTWEACEVTQGLVRHGDKQATFGELASAAADQSPPYPAPIRPKPPAEEVFSSSSGAQADQPQLAFPRIDLPAKVDGSVQFAGDVRLPGMVFASIRHGPSDGAELAAFDPDAAADISGLVGVVRGKRWLAAAAKTWWSAEQALSAMAPKFSVSYPVDSDAINARLDTLLEGGDSFPIAETGFGAQGLSRVDFARRYEVEPHQAAPLETASASARYSAGRLELWIASQAPEQARRAAAKAIGLRTEDVVLYPMPAGGSFDARLEHDHAIEIALIARELERPVQLTWPRRDEIIGARPRPSAHILIGAQLAQPQSGSAGNIDALRVRIACAPAALEFGQRLFANRTSWAAIRETSGRKDPIACEGAVPPYRLPS